jgi:hypothetical protein
LQIVVIFLIIIAAGLVVLAVSKLGPIISARQRQLFYRRRFRSLANLADHEADEILDRQVARLKKKFPGRKSEWYLEKAIYDLERDRRA